MPDENSRPPRRRRRAMFVAVILALAIGLQVPIVLALGHLTGHLAPLVGLAGALSGAFIAVALGSRSVWGEVGRARLYLVLWPFFIWWTIALLFAVVAPMALVAMALFDVSARAASTAACGVAVLGTVASLWQRPRVRKHDVFIAELPESFDGYRIAQISDLHCGPFASARRVAGWVTTVNRLGADLIAVTGDLIASGGAYIPTVAAALGELVARDGVFAIMGNHDYFTVGDAVAVALDEAGLSVLRNRGVQVRAGDASIYLAGVDDTWTRRHDLPRALADRPAGMPTILLAHDPALFPEAVRHGVDLTLSGHTHGGQLAVPLLARRWNLARLMTRFTTGVYRSGKSTLYVNRGLGTTGPPVRLAVAPEITVLTLRRAGAPRADA